MHAEQQTARVQTFLCSYSRLNFGRNRHELHGHQSDVGAFLDGGNKWRGFSAAFDRGNARLKQPAGDGRQSEWPRGKCPGVGGDRADVCRSDRNDRYLAVSIAWLAASWTVPGSAKEAEPRSRLELSSEQERQPQQLDGFAQK